MRWPLRRKLFLTVGAGAAALALVMSLLVDLTVVREVQVDEDEGLEHTRAAFQALQQYRRSQLLERCRLVTELPYFKAAAAVYDPTLSPENQKQALATVTDVARRILEGVDVDLLVLTDTQGTPLVAVGPALERGVNDLRPVSTLARSAVGREHSDGIVAVSGGLTHVTATAVEVGGLQLGALCLGTSLDSRMAGDLERMSGSAVALVGDRGLLARSSGVPADAEASLVAAWRGITGRGLRNAGTSMVKIDRARYRTLWVPLHGPDASMPGAFVVLRSEGRALAFLSQIREGLAGIALTAILIALVFSWFFARQITHPVGELVAFTRRVGSGDLSARVRIGTGDELAVLGNAFNRMAQNLTESRRGLERSKEVLEARGRELEAAVDELRRSKEETEKVNEALHEAHAQLIQAGKMAAFGELGAGIAHELRQPLTSIRGFSQLVLSRLSKRAAASRRHLELVIQAVDHMTVIVQGLKDFARKSSFELKEVDVNDVLERTCLLMGAQLRSRGVELAVSLDRGAPWVRADANQLQQVFTNLVANARDALSERGGGHLRVETRAVGAGTYLMVSVSDDGPGIPADVLPKIFNSFFTTKPEGEGTGLGLSITQGIVQDHGGKIDVSSRPGEGATFRIFLPTREARPCWEMIDCARDCRPEIAGKEECAIYRERRGHRCWESLRQLAQHDPAITQPECERCPVYMAKTTFTVEAGEDARAA